MQRRHFLAALAAAPLYPLASRAMEDHGPHAGHAMPAAAPSRRPALPPTGQPLRELPQLQNQSTAAGEFRASLSAAAGRHALLPGGDTTLWTYNNGVPGPVLALSAGDKVAIAFDNRLAEATTMHWHGLPVPPEQDGGPGQEVAAGGRREYAYAIPADWGGTFWYHPHPHGHTARQAAMGLAGPIVIRPRADPLAHLPERLLFVTDQRFDRHNQVAAHTDADWMDGREGEVVLVNGQYRPVLEVGAGEAWRLQLVNACAARYLRLQLPGHPLTLVATDGGYLEKPLTGLAELLLAPGERAELVVTMRGEPGSSVMLQSLPYVRGKMMSAEQTVAVPLLTLRYRATTRVATPALPDRLARIEPLGAPAVTRRVEMSEVMRMSGGRHRVDFLLNGKTFEMGRVDFVGKVGQVEEWQLVNRSDMDHPFHLHGTRFQVVARDGRAEVLLAWRDTVNVRPNQTVTLRCRFDTPGERVFHCHVLEHEDQGMMGLLDVRA